MFLPLSAMDNSMATLLEAITFTDEFKNSNANPDQAGKMDSAVVNDEFMPGVFSFPCKNSNASPDQAGKLVD